MRKLLGGALALSLTATSAFAGGVSGGNANSNWTIYGWQNYSIESVDADGATGMDTTRINGNAANIGFAASIDTGMNGMTANFQCEQFTFTNGASGTGLCNRNSKLSLKGGFGEIMVGQWLLPHNEMVAQWVDPFYDAGADSHTSIMGNVGASEGAFYNGGFGMDSQAFNRRQEEIIQYFSPNMNGFSFRVATTNNHPLGRDDSTPTFSVSPGTTTQDGADATAQADATTGTVDAANTFTGNSTLDPRIWSMGVSYETQISNGDSIWFAATYEQHDEWAALTHTCDDSDDKSYRLAGRYVHNMDGGMFLKLAAMYERLEYEWDGCQNIETNAGATQGVSNGSGMISNFTTASNETAASGDAAAFRDLDIERDAWMASAVLGLGNGLDIRASYMNADDIESHGSDVSDSDAEAYNLGVYYTMPAGTEMRLTYSKVDNSSNSSYDFGINGAGTAAGEDVDMWAVGLVQWF